MAVIHVYSTDASTDIEVRGSRLRAGSAQSAIDHALMLNARYSAPRYATKIFYTGEFVEPAFVELTQLAQTNGLDFEVGGA